MSSEHLLANIALTTNSAWKQVLVELARLLKERHGSAIHLYCTSPQEAAHYERLNADGRFATISHHGGPLRHVHDVVTDADATVSRAKALEERIGCTINSLTVSNRHLGRGFALAGFHHPRSRYSEGTSYAQVLNAYTAALEYWRREIEAKKITLLMNGSVELIRLAESMGIPSRTIIHARHRNYHYWSHTEFYEHPALERTYGATRVDAPASLDAPYKSHLDLRVRYLADSGLVPLARQIGWRTARHAYWRLRGYQKARGYYLSDDIKMLIRQWRSNRFLTSAKVSKLKDIAGKKFVFFPLHTEPESALQRTSPEYFFQLAAIASLARDLPADHLLVVKETYEIRGRRPDDFYDQIREFKNVVLLDMLELGLEVVKQSRAVATITGTAGMEAAVLGIPVVTFGRHNIYNFLPHVHVVRRDEELRPALRAALDDGLDRNRTALDGARFLAALKASSFDLGNLDLVAQNAIEPAAVEDSYRIFIDSLRPIDAKQLVEA